MHFDSLRETLPQSFPTPKSLLFLAGQDDDIKDCINQGLSERDSSPRLAEGGWRGVAAPWFGGRRMTERRGSATGVGKLRERHEFWPRLLGRICRWRREMTQKNNGQTIWHRGSYTSPLSRVSSIVANRENTLHYTLLRLLRIFQARSIISYATTEWDSDRNMWLHVYEKYVFSYVTQREILITTRSSTLPLRPVAKMLIEQ